MDDGLDPDEHDQLTAITRGASSLVPLVGGVLGELFTTTIPNQRLDRVVRYIRALEARLSELEKGFVAGIATSPEKVNLIEEGAYQAARSTTQERIESIARVVFKGLNSDEAEIVRRKRLLLLLGQIDEDEATLLNAYGQSYGGESAEAWELVDRPEPTHLQSTVDELDKEKLFEAGRDNLLRLGLLQKKYSNVKRGELPQFDHFSGDFKFRLEISYLGRMLLRELGKPTPIDLRDE